jgi:carbon-monoxide dehydrogenase medium subunit
VKLPSFDYRRVRTVEEALVEVREHGEEAKVLAGGQSLVPLLALRLARPAVIVDIGPVRELAALEHDGGEVAIGAMVREAAAERSAVVREHVPLLAEALPLIGHVAIRNRGTIGGSVAHGDPAAEIPAVALALDATVVVASASRGERVIPAAAFFKGFLTTALADDEVLLAIRFPVAAPGAGAAFAEAARRHGEFAMVGAATSITVMDGHVADARIALIGVAGTPVRATGAEAILAGADVSTAAIDEAAREAVADLAPTTDLHATAAYRKHVARVLVGRSLRSALNRALVAA